MKEAVLFKNLNNNLVQCQACSWKCNIAPGQTGICGIRENREGKLYLLVYGKAVGMHLDPMEKKPLYHFLPGAGILSFGTLGCNFGCLFCQNAFQSQSPKELKTRESLLRLIDTYSENYPPAKIVDLALKYNVPAIAYTYNEPTVFMEYAHDTAKLAHEKGLKNVFVSNGYESEESFAMIKPYLDAANIDLKAFNPDFYRNLCKTHIEPVLENIKRFHQAGVWIEVTTLIIPETNDSPEELQKIAEYIASIDENIPWHVSAFRPAYKMSDHRATPPETLYKAYDIGKKANLKHVYVGNIFDKEHSVTYCPKCDSPLIERTWGGSTTTKDFENGKCTKCNTKIKGVWA